MDDLSKTTLRLWCDTQPKKTSYADPRNHAHMIETTADDCPTENLPCPIARCGGTVWVTPRPRDSDWIEA